MAANTTTIARCPRIIEVQGSITRPNDANQYTAGDAISDNATTPTTAGYFAFDFGGIDGAGLQLLDFTLHKSDQDQTTCDIGLLLFTTLPALAGFEDNAAIAITDAEMKECKGVVEFVTGDWVNVATGDIQTVTKRIGIVTGSATSTVYGILVANSAYTPAANEIFTVTIHGIQEAA